VTSTARTTTRPAARDLRSALLVSGASIVVGVLVGLVWRWVAPLSAYRNRDGAGIPVGGDETAVAADGWFAVCAAVAGILVALAVVALLRSGRLGSLVGLVAGGLLGAVVAWRTGLLLSPPTVTESLASVGAGQRFDGPLRISAIGVLLAWPMTAAITFFAVVAGLEPEDEPAADDWLSDGPDGAGGGDACPGSSVSPDGRWVPPAPR
jgi:hypothetical protein